MIKSKEKRNRTVIVGRGKGKERSSEKGITSVRKSSDSNQLRGEDVQTANQILLYLQEHEKF